MNLLHIMTHLEKADPEVYNRLDTRRAAMKSFTSFSTKLALAAVPIALGSMFNKAYAGAKGSKETVLEVLNYALTLEYLEAEFYATAVSKGTSLVPAGAAATAIMTIADHEAQHVTFLKTAISGAGGTPVDKPVFDLSGGKGTGTGPFKDAFSNYELFLAVAQTLEDTGVRAYKGRAAELVQAGDVLTAALNIHSVEARHAAHIRSMRKANGFGDVKPWITGKETGIGDIVQASYNGEENTKQATIDIININGQPINAAAASEAFDEPLSKEQVLTIVNPFLVP
ncbi:MAG TPA: ferritin-like domain-containing protein [Flavitalea sp.]|nr:ferritin-like domain-containing protein [Flavitalea sp.]